MPSPRRPISRPRRSGLRGRSPSFYFLVIVFLGGILYIAWDITQSKQSEPSTIESPAPPPASPR